MIAPDAARHCPKDWVVPPDEVGVQGQAHWWLFKPIKHASYRRYDDWAEKLAGELAGLLNLPCARVELAQGDSDRGIISANVTPNGWSVESGDTMLSEFPGYLLCAGEDRPKNRIGHNLSNVERVLEGCAGPPGSACADWTGSEVFAGFLVFDAWVANTDRHAINWGVLTCEEDGRHALAASFDHGSALGSGTQDQRLASPRCYDSEAMQVSHLHPKQQRLVAHDMLVDAEPGHPGEPGLVVGHRLEQRPDRGPDRVPGRAQLTGDPGDRGMLVADLADRPPTRPRRQQRPWRRDLPVLLGEHLDRARRLDTAPRPYAPHQLHQPVETRRINQPDLTTAVARRNHPTARAATHRQGRLHTHRQPTSTIAGDGSDMQPVKADQ
jgi:hypothetical protein